MRASLCVWREKRPYYGHFSADVAPKSIERHNVMFCWIIFLCTLTTYTYCNTTHTSCRAHCCPRAQNYGIENTAHTIKNCTCSIQYRTKCTAIRDLVLWELDNSPTLYSFFSIKSNSQFMCTAQTSPFVRAEKSLYTVRQARVKQGKQLRPAHYGYCFRFFGKSQTVN